MEKIRVIGVIPKKVMKKRVIQTRNQRHDKPLKLQFGTLLREAYRKKGITHLRVVR